ncbi:MAG: hypothetical protein ACYC1D_15405 [Acidimicrobiales bacterium]
MALAPMGWRAARQLALNAGAGIDAGEATGGHPGWSRPRRWRRVGRDGGSDAAPTGGDAHGRGRQAGAVSTISPLAAQFGEVRSKRSGGSGGACRRRRLPVA